MAYTRKTEDEWEIWSKYSTGWELETTETSWKLCRDNLKLYRENCPGVQFKVKKVRVKKEKENVSR